MLTYCHTPLKVTCGFFITTARHDAIIYLSYWSMTLAVLRTMESLNVLSPGFNILRGFGYYLYLNNSVCIFFFINLGWISVLSRNYLLNYKETKSKSPECGWASVYCCQLWKWESYIWFGNGPSFLVDIDNRALPKRSSQTFFQTISAMAWCECQWEQRRKAAVQGGIHISRIKACVWERVHDNWTLTLLLVA